jgi:5'-methylthioadenosine nucleosidase
MIFKKNHQIIRKKIFSFLSEIEQQNNEINKIHTILIIIAMEDEASPTISYLGLKQLQGNKKFPFKIYGGEKNGKRIVLMTSGKDSTHGVDNVGPQVASSMATIGIHEFDPNVVVNMGTAGGFKASGAKIGSVYVGTKAQFHDRRIPIPKFDKYGSGDYNTTTPTSINGMFKSATISTGSSLDITDAEKERLSKQSQQMAVVKEMEAAAIAQVCQWNSTPFVVIKAITDLIDSSAKTEEEFLKNLKIASKSLQTAFSKIIDKL